MDGFSAPFVEQSKIKIGLKFEEEHLIKANNTRLIVGSVQLIVAPNDCIKENGYLDIESVESVCISGLDTYHKTQKIETFPRDYIKNNAKSNR